MHSSARAPLLLLLVVLGCREREMGWPRPDFAPNVEFGPRIKDLSTDSFHVTWRTIAPVRGAVEVRTAAGEPWRRSSTTRELTRDHDIRVSDLIPWEYRLLHNDHAVTAPIRLRPRTANQTTFAVLGDSGSGGEHQFAVTRQMAQHDPEFVLHTGDLGYDRGTRREMIRRFFVPYARSLATRPWFVAWGNHDVMTGGGKELRAMLSMPGEHYYAIDRGSTRFYVLDSNIDFQRGSPQHDWLVSDLQSEIRKNRIAVFHHAPYSGSPYARTFKKRSAKVREHLCPVFDQFGFSLVFNGHVHGYERAEPEGRKPVYITTGGGGKRLNEPGTAKWTKLYSAVWHFCVVTITKDEIVVRAINEAGEEFDRYSTPRGS
jgi:3',5'-cyclic AMP phosphodiesterase CpdA